MEEIAYAKINLALHVRAREADGYHRIETLFDFAEDGDRLLVGAAEGLELEVSGPFAGQLGPGADNLVVRAAEALRSRFGVRAGAALKLEKRLPVASGIGGGSADAAAALRLLSRFWKLEGPEEALLEIAAGLGADVPACLFSRSMRGEGRGDHLAPAGDGLKGVPLLLANPGVPLSTADVFRAWDRVDRGPLPGDPASGRNDLEPPARALVPEIAEVLGVLAQADGVSLARMSGSGATCFALFESEAQRDKAKARIAEERPQWWTMASRIR